MSRSILVPLDGSDPARQALEFALEHHPDAEITAYYVIDTMSTASQTMINPEPAYESELYEAEEEHAESVLSDAEALAGEYGADIETVIVHGLAREAIIDYVEDNEIDQVIMGSHGRSGVKRVLIGSVAEKVTRHVSVPVTLVHPDEP
jgi:nucleotide-binding universal stress UspA family protein